MAQTDIKAINKATLNIEESIKEADEKYQSFILTVADRILSNDNIKIILLAGPSGSGKTTTANMMADGIRARGKEAIVISLDDFYKNATDPTYPRLSTGERDFESPEALDMAEIERVLLAAASDEPFTIPRFDFKLGARKEGVKHGKMQHGCLIIEGLHALNPKISEHLPKDKILKIFISVSTNINESGERILSGRKLRFARRMVRDSIYRGADAERTLELWQNVLAGEDKYLYPYRELADIKFDTFHIYEIGLMRPFCERLITKEVAGKSAYAAAVLNAVQKADIVPEKLVSDKSLLREFIPGGKYEELY